MAPDAPLLQSEAHPGVKSLFTYLAVECLSPPPNHEHCEIKDWVSRTHHHHGQNILRQAPGEMNEMGKEAAVRRERRNAP